LNSISSEIKKLLIDRALYYNSKEFITSDPIKIPHCFVLDEDIEISAFLVSTIAWGNRTMILRNGEKLMNLLNGSPYEFLIHANEKEWNKFRGFVHRTFNSDDLIQFLYSLKKIYLIDGGLRTVFYNGFKIENSVESAIRYFRTEFIKDFKIKRTYKHIPDIDKGSAAKRLNMFLRWMVRNDNCGVDFGIWKQIPASSLLIPLDVHVANVARSLGLLKRKQNDWKAVIELTEQLKIIDKNDPVQFDFALFGMGVNNFL
jgi:uncharacterized protein (TIGR02757 family)